MQGMIERYLRKQVWAGRIAAEDSNIYRYGYTLLSETAINLLIAALIGLVMHELGIVVGFLLLFIPLRSFCGGYHAQTFWKCMLLSNVVIFTAVYVVGNYAERIVPFGYVVAEVLSVAVILKLAPVQSKNKRLGKREINLYRKVIRWILLVQVVVCMIAFWMRQWEVVMTIALVHGIQAVTSVAG